MSVKPNMPVGTHIHSPINEWEGNYLAVTQIRNNDVAITEIVFLPSEKLFNMYTSTYKLDTTGGAKKYIATYFRELKDKVKNDKPAEIQEKMNSVFMLIFKAKKISIDDNRVTIRIKE